MRRLETVRSQAECWQERHDGRLSRADLWGRGGEIPLRYPTRCFLDIWFSGQISICILNRLALKGSTVLPIERDTGW